jgi:hypothetical protein
MKKGQAVTSDVKSRSRSQAFQRSPGVVPSRPDCALKLRSPQGHFQFRHDAFRIGDAAGQRHCIGDGGTHGHRNMSAGSMIREFKMVLDGIPDALSELSCCVDACGGQEHRD